MNKTRKNPKNPKSSPSNEKSKICDKNMTFQECELAILRQAVDESEKIQGKKVANSPEVQAMVKILEDFLISTKCICYGGTAINNILPNHARFYNKEIEVPDYDFYSKDALSDAKKLADIYYKHGYADVEAKAGVHHGTFKVFVNYIPIADITQLHPNIYNAITKECISVYGILYAPPNFLRMSMFLELSRPSGDVSRWEKVLKRLTLLNQHYPLTPNNDCTKIDFQRKMETHQNDSDRLYYLIRDTFIDQGVVFFGGYASSLYSRYMSGPEKRIVDKIPDFDVLSEDIDRTAFLVTERLKENGFSKVQHIEHPALGELIPRHIEIRVDKETLAFIYEPIACHNYNEITVSDKVVKVASIDTILSFYLAFYFSDEPYNYKDRILCIIKFLFDVEQKNRLSQSGLLKRFSIQCYGKQSTVEELRAEKMQKFEELKNKRNTEEYEMWFLAYNPGAENKKNENKKNEKHEMKKKYNKDKNPNMENLSVNESSSPKNEQKEQKKTTKKQKTRKIKRYDNVQYKYKYKRKGFLYG